eukprot:IDg9314t1
MIINDQVESMLSTATRMSKILVKIPSTFQVGNEQQMSRFLTTRGTDPVVRDVFQQLQLQLTVTDANQ